jgi:hypothetical protein
MFGPDADVNPLKRPPNASSVSELRQNPPEISHDNTRMRDDDDLEPSRNSGRSVGRTSRYGYLSQSVLTLNAYRSSWF